MKQDSERNHQDRASVAPGLELVVAGLTDLGRVRKNNEDAFLIFDLSAPSATPPADASLAVGPRGLVLAVADGMGGSQAGEVASTLALDAVRRSLSGAPGGAMPDLALRRAIECANQEVFAAARAPETDGIGATLTACLVQGTTAYVAVVGDSRAYVLRGRRLVQLTHDQSYVQFLIDSGTLSARDASHSLLRNVVLQAVGKAPEVTVAMSRLALRRDDQLLLCTDGLTNMAQDGEVASLVASAMSPAMACVQLISRANQHGGRDNITVIVARVGGQVSEWRDDEDFAATFRILTTYEPDA